MDLVNLGTFIHKKREEVGISLAKAAQKAGIGRSTLWVLEQGINPKTGKPSRPSRDILERLAEVLHMSQTEFEELLTLAGYDLAKAGYHPTKQLIQTSETQQLTFSPPATITEINGTVYIAHNTYLEAFEAKTGNRLWYSPIGKSPLETTLNSVSDRIEQIDSSSLSHVVDAGEFLQKTEIANVPNITRFDGRSSKSSTSEVVIDQVSGIIADLKELIMSGKFGKKGRLPALRRLANDYDTTLEMINKVIYALQKEGWIDQEMFVIRPRVRMFGLPKNSSDNIIELGLRPIEEYIEDPKVFAAPTEIAEKMRIAPDGLVVRRFRKLGASNVTYRILDSYFPKDLVSDAMFERMTDSSYDVLPEIKAQAGKYIKHIYEDVLARLPTQYEQELLQIVLTNPVVDIKRINMAPDQKTVVMYNHVVLDANHYLLSYRYEVNLWD